MGALQPVSPGQPLRFSAGDINACFEAARAHRERLLRQEDIATSLPQSGIVMVKNNTANDREILEVLAIDAPLILPTESLGEFRGRVALSCILPGATHAGRYAILQEPIPAGKIGRAMVIGVTPALLDVTAESDRFAEVVSTVATSLKTGTTGSARILWKESGTGAKKGVVMLTGEPGGAAVIHTAAANPTADDDTGDGYVVGTIWINTTTDAAFIATDVTATAAAWTAVGGVSVHTAAANPAVTDDSGDGYTIGTIWVNTSTDATFIASDVTAGAAVWTAVGGASPVKRAKFVTKLTSGTSYTVPSTYAAYMFVLIGGGGGGGEETTATYGMDLAEYSGGGSARIYMQAHGGGGGGGETVIIRWVNTAAVSSLTYAIGAAGAASAAGGNTDITIDGTLVRATGGGAGGAAAVVASVTHVAGVGGVGGTGTGPGIGADSPTNCIVERFAGHDGEDGGIMVHLNATTDVKAYRELAGGGRSAYSGANGTGGDGSSASGVPQAGTVGCILVFGLE
jgi:hypothetical protein